MSHIKEECYKLQNKNKRDAKNDEKGKYKSEVIDVNVVEDIGNAFLLASMSESFKHTSE